MMELLAFDTIDERPADEEDYDLFAQLIGRGLPNKAGVYLLPYLQTGHILLLATLLLCATITYPGFPLTQVPDEYKAIVWQGIGLTFLVNAGTAVYARGVAEAKGQSANFWSAKCFLLGGLALGELTQAVPDAPKKVFPNQRR